MQTVRNFCSTWSNTFVRRELWYFLNAVVRNDYDNQRSISPDGAFEWFEEMSSLMDAAYLLYGNQAA
jgi:hypothetical protein